MDLDINFRDKALYIKDIDTLVVSDLHLGRKKRDSPYPKMEHKEIETRLNKLINLYEPKNIVFNGDTFNQGCDDDYNRVMFRNFDNNVMNMVFISGNHDVRNSGLPDSISDEYTIKNKHVIDNIVFYHGHTDVSFNANIQIVGHLHPCVNGSPVSLYHPKGYKNKKTIVLPAFSNLVRCVEVNSMQQKEYTSPIASYSNMDEYNIIYNYKDASDFQV